jgi:hypothetical protein
MTTQVISRVAIQARIAELQRQYRKTEHTPIDFLFANEGADRARWFRQA